MADMVVDMVADIMVDMTAFLGCSFLYLGDLLIEGVPVPLDHLHISEIAKIY